ncbi:MAG: transglutaminase family protein [Acidobacteriota bacterium]
MARHKKFQSDSGRPVEEIVHFSDDAHPLVAETAASLTEGKAGEAERLGAIFYFVRDEIKYGFPALADTVKASQTMEARIGQAVTKTTLMAALCRAAGIHARLHFGLIDQSILRGVLPSAALAVLPRFSSHAWLEVEIEGRWRRLDTYIMDKLLFQAARMALLRKGWKDGFGLACQGGRCGCDLTLEERYFVQMDALTEDHGLWQDGADYMASGQYRGMATVPALVYRRLAAKANRSLEALRQGHGAAVF